MYPNINYFAYDARVEIDCIKSVVIRAKGVTMYTELYNEIVKVKDDISNLDFAQILDKYIRVRNKENKSLYDQALINVVESGMFIDQTKHGEFCLMFQLPATSAAMMHYSDGNITMHFNHPVDDEFTIRQTLSFDLDKVLEFKPRAEKLKEIIGEWNFNELMKSILTAGEEE